MLYSQDEDFLAIATLWQAESREFAGLIYSHQLKITIGQAVLDLEFMSQMLEPDQMRNRIEYIPL